MLLRIPTAGTEPALATGFSAMQSLCLGTVSYTHLDVYKRQHLLFAAGERSGDLTLTLFQSREQLKDCLLYTSFL